MIDLSAYEISAQPVIGADMIHFTEFGERELSLIANGHNSHIYFLPK